MRWFVLICGISFLAWPGVAIAQDSDAPPESEAVEAAAPDEELLVEDIDLFDLDIPVIVTASRRAQKVTAVPYAVSVITAEDIRLSGARSIPDALRLAAGVDVSDLSYGAAAVSPRGFHGFVARQALVLVDGRQIFDSLFGGTLWGNWPFQLEDIARIEVIRGPGGVTWGANAVNGVINIITKDPRDQLGLTLTGRGGSRGTNKEYLGYGVEDGKLRLRVSGEHESSDGWRGGSLFGRSDDAYRAGRFNLHAVYDKSADDTYIFSAGAQATEDGYAATPLAGLGMRRQAGSQAEFVMGTWRHRISEMEHFEVVGYVNDFYASPGAKQIDYRYQQFALQFAHTLAPAKDHTLTWGVDTRADLLDATNADPQMLTRGFVSTGILGVYAQDTWRFAPRWTLDLGARVDYEFYGGFQPSARAALAYELNESSSLYTSVSRAFQMIPPGLRFLDIPLLNGISHVVGKRDLDASTLIAYEIGYRAKWFERMDVNLNLYWNSFDDLTPLAPRLGPPGLLVMDIDNRAAATLYGAEFDANYKVNDRLSLLANYTYQEMEWDSVAGYHGSELMVPPSHKFMLGARYNPTEDLHLSAHLYYVDATRAPNVSFPFGARHIDPYFRLDLRAEHDLWNDQASIAVGVRNLLNPSHPEGSTLFLNDVESERMVYAEFRVTIR